MGGVIAYPTEAVYGLGCDPRDESAVRSILVLKSRNPDMGLILVSDSFCRFKPFIETVPAERQLAAEASWPGPYTWLYPRAAGVPDWLAGKHPTIAIRVSAHPVCQALSMKFGAPIVSTSANPHASPAATSAEQVEAYFGENIDGIVEGEIGDEPQPSEIRDVLSGRLLRGAGS